MRPIFRLASSACRRIWHQAKSRFAGCPGIKGPVPPPVLMGFAGHCGGPSYACQSLYADGKITLSHKQSGPLCATGFVADHVLLPTRSMAGGDRLAFAPAAYKGGPSAPARSTRQRGRGEKSLIVANHALRRGYVPSFCLVRIRAGLCMVDGVTRVNSDQAGSQSNSNAPDGAWLIR